MKQILLFGDSLTQRGFEIETEGWAARLANHYIRRADIVNRGYSGYTSEWFLHLLPRLSIPPPNQTLFSILFLGANDAVLSDANPHQHTPLARFQANLRNLCVQLKQRTQAPLLLITPPAVVPEHWAEHCRAKGREVDRCVAQTAAYADAVVAVGELEGVPVVRLHERMLGWAEGHSGGLGALLCDGLHLSALGNRLLFESVLECIGESLVDIDVDKLKMEFPYHADVDPKRLDECMLP